MASAVYLGPVGGLVSIPPPVHDWDRTRPKRVAVQELLSGGNVVDRWGGRSRIVMRWNVLTADQLSVLETLFQLPGPYVLVDPARRNHLTVNQSSGTGLLTTTGFVTNTGTLTSDATFNPALQPPRSLKWTNAGALGTTGNGPMTGASATTAALLDDIAAVTGLPYSVSVTALRTATNAITCAARVEWYDTAGAFISGSTGSGTALSSGSWSTLTHANQTAPAGTAWVKARLVNTATTAGATAVYADGWQLEPAATASAWVLGAGVPVVSPVDLTITAPTPPYLAAELVLQEL